MSFQYQDKESWAPEAARLRRYEHKVAAAPNKAARARLRGYFDFMLDLPLKREEFGYIGAVSYDQGVEKAKKWRSVLSERSWKWTEREFTHDGNKWHWAVYAEGWLVGSGESRTQREAENAAESAALDDMTHSAN